MSVVEGIGNEVIAVSLLMFILFIITIAFYIRDFSNVYPTSVASWFAFQPQVTATPQQPENPTPEEQEPVRSQNTESNPSESVSSDNQTVNSEVPHNECDSYQGTNGDAQSADAPSVTSEERTENCNTHGDTSTSEANNNQEDSVPEAAQLPPNMIRVRLKYLNDTERVVISARAVKIKDFKRAHFAEDLASNKTVRLIFNGQLLRDNMSLFEWGITNDTVVHVHISNVPVLPTTSTEVDSNLDLSHVLCPLIVIILSVCWYSYFQYPEFFSIPSMLLLMIFTLSFVIVCVYSAPIET